MSPFPWRSHSLRRLSRALLAVALIVLGWYLPTRADAESAGIPGRRARLTVLFDYANRSMIFDGPVSTSDGSSPDLVSWGLNATRPPVPIQGGSAGWNVHGTIATARLVSVADDVYRFQLGPLYLNPNDELTLILPFVNVDYPRVTPRPQNLADLIRARSAEDNPPGAQGIRFVGRPESALTLDIPFVPMKRTVVVSVTPLLGGMTRSDTTALRISGQLSIASIRDYWEFSALCQANTASLLAPYREEALLSVLDSPPAIDVGLFSPMYEAKPTYLHVWTDLRTCRLESGEGTVEATFDGRAFANHSSTPADRFAGLVPIGIRRVADPSDAIYELDLGEIALGPRDALTLAVPGAEIRSVFPPPSRYDFAKGGEPSIVYLGPQRVSLRIRFVATPRLFRDQIPSLLRAQLQPVETLLGSSTATKVVSPLEVLGGTGFLLLIGATLVDEVFSRSRFAGRWQRLASVAVGGAMGVGGLAFLDLFRGVFGLLLLAVLASAVSLVHSPRRTRGLVRVGMVLLLILAAMEIDRHTIDLFARLNTLDLEITPVTPLILLPLEAGFLLIVPWHPNGGPRVVGPLALGLLALDVFDVVEKSLLAFVILAFGVGYLTIRSLAVPDAMEKDETARRIRDAWSIGPIRVGLLAMMVFAVQYSLQSTFATLSSLQPSLGILGTIAPVGLSLISVVQGTLALGVSFVILYPLLPFEAGYLRALVFGGFLTGVFTLGIGSDDRLISSLELLLVSRLVYYVSVPLLIGLCFDVHYFIQQEQRRGWSASSTPKALPFGEAVGIYLKNLHGAFAAVSALAGVVAPGLYASVANAPVVTTYFDLVARLTALN